MRHAKSDGQAPQLRYSACMLFTIVLTLATGPAVAQKFGDFDASDIDVDEMMSKAGELQECMSNIDQDEVAQLQAEAEAVQQEIRALCADDKRKEAQSRAVAFGQELAEKPVVKELQACSGLAGKTIPQMAWTQLDESEQVQQHVCDL